MKRYSKGEGCGVTLGKREEKREIRRDEMWVKGRL